MDEIETGARLLLVKNERLQQQIEDLEMQARLQEDMFVADMLMFEDLLKQVLEVGEIPQPLRLEIINALGEEEGNELRRI